jgi:hypothetical protein
MARIRSKQGYRRVRSSHVRPIDGNDFSTFTYQDCIDCGISGGQALAGTGNLNMTACANCRNYISSL